MEKEMTPVRIANSISQDRRHKGYYVLVEGKKDLQTYKKFLKEDVSLKVTFGKHRMREVYEILTGRGFIKKIGIRDADYLRLIPNDKFDKDYAENIFISDCHDSEGMIINSDALKIFIDNISSEDNLLMFNKKHNDIRGLLYSLCYPLACLRFANKKYTLGLAFKPVESKGSKIKYKTFICEREFKYLGHEKMVTAVMNYSVNRGGKLASKQEIILKLEEVLKMLHPYEQIVNGHDLSEILYLVCKKGLRSSSKILQDSGCLEEMLYLAYGSSHFSESLLYRCIVAWQEKSGERIFCSDRAFI